MTQSVTVAPALAGPVGEIEAAYSAVQDQLAAAETNLTTAQTQISTQTTSIAQLNAQLAASQTALGTDSAELTADAATIAALQAQLAALLPKPILGFAPGATPSYLGAWDKACADLGWVPALRTYESTIPPAFNGTHAGKVLASKTPPTHIIQSLIVSETATWASQTAALTTYLTSVQAAITAAKAAGQLLEIRLCPRHEPEQQAKNIDPAKYGPMVGSFVKLCGQVAPDVIPVEIYMTYTADTRTLGVNAWLAAAGHAKEVLWDGYWHTTAYTAESIFGPDVALCKALFPHMRQGVAEWGFNNDLPNGAKIITDSYAYFTSVGMTITSYFDEVASADYTLDTTPALVAAFKGLPRTA